MAPEGRDHDPTLALFSGADGLDAMSVVAATAARLLRLPVAVLIGTQAFRGVRDHPGRTSRPRFVTVSSAIRGLLTSFTSPFYCH